MAIPAALGLVIALALLTEDSWARRGVTIASALAALVLDLTVDRSIDGRRTLAEARRVAALHVMPPAPPLPQRVPWVSLLNLLYGVAHFQARTADLAALDGFLSQDNAAVAIVQGPRWCGKSRLVAHWAAGVSEAWSGGWVLPGHGREGLETAAATADHTLLLLDGVDEDAFHVLEGIAASHAAVRAVLVAPDHLDIPRLAEAHSRAAGLSAQSSWTRRLGPVGARSDHERWFERLVRDYAMALHKPSAGLGILPSSTRPMSIGLLNILALATVVRQKRWGHNPRLEELLRDLWTAQVAQ